MTNHWMLESGDPIRPRLGEVTAPTLVLHGTEDPLFPIGHGVALAEAIPGAELVVLPDEAHQPFQERPEEWNAIVDDFWSSIDA